MRRLATAIGLVAVGLIGAAFVTLLTWVFERLEARVLGADQAQAIDNAVLPDWFYGLAVVMLALVVAVPLVLQWRRRWRRRRFEAAILGLIRPEGPLHGVHLSEDGRFAYLGLKVSAAAWGPSHPLFAERTYRTTAGAMDALTSDAEFRFPLLTMRDGAPAAVSVDVETLSGTIDVIVVATGWLAGLHRGAGGLRSVVADLGIPVVTPVVTAACVFVQGLTRPDTVAAQQYLESGLGAWLTRKTPALSAPSRGLRLERVETRVRRAPDMAPIIFITDLKGQSLEQIQARISGVRHDFAFASLGQARFIASEP